MQIEKVSTSKLGSLRRSLCSLSSGNPFELPARPHNVRRTQRPTINAHVIQAAVETKIGHIAVPVAAQDRVAAQTHIHNGRPIAPTGHRRPIQIKLLRAGLHHEGEVVPVRRTERAGRFEARPGGASVVLRHGMVVAVTRRMSAIADGDKIRRRGAETHSPVPRPPGSLLGASRVRPARCSEAGGRPSPGATALAPSFGRSPGRPRTQRTVMVIRGAISGGAWRHPHSTPGAWSGYWYSRAPGPPGPHRAY